MVSKVLSRQALLSGTAIVVFVTLVKLILHLATSGQYGYFRDELYYIAASEHLDLGYVDFPAFIAYLTAFVRWLLGESLFSLRFFPAVAGALIVLLTGLMARALGGGRFAQAMASMAALFSGMFLGVNSLLSMDTFDQLWWVLGTYVLIVLFKSGDSRLWLLFGLIAGLGLLTKVTMLYLGFGLVIGLLLTSQRRYLADRWLWVGGLIALGMLLPYILWQVMHGWPTLEFWRVYADGKTYPVSPIDFVVQQIVTSHPLTVPLTLAGLYFYLRAKDGQPYRPLGWIYVSIFVVLMAQKAKFYFLGPTYPMLFAAGAVAVEKFIGQRGWNWLKPTYASLLIATGIAAAPLAAPLLSPDNFVQYMSVLGSNPARMERLEESVMPQYFADRFGWPELATTVAGVYRRLPPEERSKACIFTANYGEAGAIDFFGKAYGLPRAISGHNSYYVWGAGDCTGDVIIFVGMRESDLRNMFDQVEEAARTECRYCMPYENRRPIYVARKPKVSPGAAWPQVKHFD
ncbi:MAG: glycosyltransferase family 39 protein [Chloroflexi bacterium]|nr:glycosyltransferase family 39 protein [Chloroflexota bacterium]